jgi:hypothetical protein
MSEDDLPYHVRYRHSAASSAQRGTEPDRYALREEPRRSHAPVSV